ncbi:hypothetical protein [Piscinibacter sakaiensis]|uniref:Regulatory protein, RpfE type n=1 Tax=Piscinibacter sakaiensis TaxID=1547922 RepID=A0A0K8NVL4_PISS1|nr:hypothetical protein [Piscinibacter sakaiensis]GAP34432.1 regulatory protein, RpfE type [Piscinibacter sakaiensis]
MHLLIPYAGAQSPACVSTLSHLRLPQLERLLRRMDAGAAVGGDEAALNLPHERALAAAWGWQGADGCLPFAARAAAADGVAVDGRPWGLLTPVHCAVGRDHVTLDDPDALALGADESRAVFDAVRELFTSEGYALAWGAPLRWYLAHEEMDGLPGAALERVIGRNVDAWLQAGLDGHPAGRRLRRLQNEVQMLLYTHPLTDARDARGAPAVNSVWLSGVGRPQPADPAATPQVDERLRTPLLHEDWAAWAEAWAALDAGPVAALAARAEAGEPAALTLAGERLARTWTAAPLGRWAALRRRWQPAPEPARVLEGL